MNRLFPYIKRYSLPIVISILLLFAQAQADLTLPDYLSKIVNYGIQQGGVETELPSALSDATYQHISVFLSADEKATVDDAYTWVEAGSADYEAAAKAYPNLNGSSVHILKTLSQPQQEALIPILQSGLVTVSMLEQLQKDPSKAAMLGAGMGFDLSKLPPGMSMFDILAKLGPEKKTPILNAIKSRFDSIDSKILSQMNIAAIKAEYTALGLDMEEVQTNYILRTGGMMILITLASVIATILVGLISARVAAGVARDLRHSVFVRVSDFANAEIEKFSTASLITRATNDVTQLQTVTMMVMRMVFYAPIVGVGGLLRALKTAPSMGWIIALMVVALLSLIIGVFSISMPRFRIIQTLIDNLNRVVRENLSGMMVVRAFNRQPFEENRFDKANRDLTQNTLFVSRVMTIMMPTMMLLMSSVSLLVVWVGAHQIDAAQLQVGDMMAFMQYTMQIFFAFMFMSMMFIILPRAHVSANRIADVLETKPSIIENETPSHFAASFGGTVEFRNVSFHYPDAEEDVLHDINFIAKPGQTTAFIGTTGSGKSTIVNLMPRFYDVTSGSILIDGIDIRDVPQTELRAKIGYVPQRSNLFSGTIESNLKFGDENATPEEIALALEIAQASEFIRSTPEGIEMPISQGGTNVSGGQRQRLAIARALIKRSPITVFDDSFSALDFKTDAALRAALKKHVSGSTVFIVSQRVATIKNAEQIIVLDEGVVVGKGTHHELMKSCDVYRDIATSQLSQEELA